MSNPIEDPTEADRATAIQVVFGYCESDWYLEACEVILAALTAARAEGEATGRALGLAECAAELAQVKAERGLPGMDALRCAVPGYAHEVIDLYGEGIVEPGMDAEHWADLWRNRTTPENAVALIGRLVAERDQFAAENAVLVAERDGEKASLSMLRNAIDTANDNCERFRIERDRLRIERDRLRIEHDRLRIEHDRLRIEHDRLRVERDRFRAVLDTTKRGDIYA